ncbi:MAG: TraR/DksA C4-type zinc finger protein [Candidatus Krumholzibacteria bacterium]|nr:TraR/DksA C4-type zinc finger protein [Candidatus Krumholzibacteria bacterium]
MPIKKIVRKIAKKFGKKGEKKRPAKVAAKTTPKPTKKIEARKSPVNKIEVKKPEAKKAEARKPDLKRKRLAKKELEHYRQKLLVERDRILRELGRITEAINESAEEQEAAKQSYSNHLADIGSDYMEKEKNYYYADQEGQYLKAIEVALARIESGEYGQCLECLDLISDKRLEAVPAAELCINCKDKKEKLERGR